MTIEEFSNLLNGKIIGANNGIVPDKANCYCGDLLSDVLKNATEQGIWFTVLTGINVCAVAVAKKIGLVVICGGNEPEKNVIKQLNSNGINAVLTELNSYEALQKYILNRN